MIPINKLRWRCRRGVLELDLILSRYLESGYSSADPRQQAAFLELLELEDNDLLRYLMGEAQPANAAIAEIISSLRVLPLA